MRIICKRCGSDRFHEAGTVDYTQDIDLDLDAEGKILVETHGSIDHGYDREREDYVCSGCEASAHKIEALVIVEPEDTDLFRCDECDHYRHQHSERGYNAKLHSRGLVGCDVDGCRCRDFVPVPSRVPEIAPGQLRLEAA